jgi:hypothetical protein
MQRTTALIARPCKHAPADSAEFLLARRLAGHFGSATGTAAWRPPADKVSYSLPRGSQLLCLRGRHWNRGVAGIVGQWWLGSTLWRIACHWGLLGLLIWPALFRAGCRVPFVNPYQDAPLDLYWPDFVQSRAEACIERCLDGLSADSHALQQQVWQTWRDKRETQCALLHWPSFDAAALEQVLNGIPAAHIELFCRFLLSDLEQGRRGFPDLLLVFGPGQYELVEVKGPSDQLRPEQRRWFDLFQRHDVPARVLKVRW